MDKTTRLNLIIFLVLLALVIAGCERGLPVTTNVWIDVPVDGITVSEGETLQIEGHATSPEGIALVEIWINGELQFEVTNPIAIDNLARFSQLWTPPGTGEYTIQALAMGADGSVSEPDNAIVHVGGLVPDDQPALVEPSQDETPEPSTVDETPTLTPTTPPSVVIDFWADPGEINAGGRFTVYWHVENVSTVIFGGLEQPFDGSYSDELCASERYTLTVIHDDGTEEKRAVDITVQGACVTPTFTPVPDTTPPPIPNQLKPINGSDLGCISDLMMRWDAVVDPSGISEYQIEVQRHPGNNQWIISPGSPFTGIGDTERIFSTECGWEYRWRIRAIDGVGNVGNWSGWFSFIIPLT